MAFDVIYQQPLYRTFRASQCSFASLITFIFSLLEILIPIVIVFTTQGLWRKTGTFREVPDVSFEGKYIILANQGDTYTFSSTLPILNSADVEHLTPAELTQHWTSENEQNMIELYIRFAKRNSSVDTLTYFLFFKYKLSYNSEIQTELAVIDTVYLTAPTSSLTVFGRLGKDQRKPFRSRYAYNLLDSSRRDPEHYRPAEIMRRSAAADIALLVNGKSELRIPGTKDDKYFHFSMKLLVTEEEFTYRTSLVELLKWAWIQYLAVWFVIRYFCRAILDTLFENNVVEAIPSSPCQQLKDSQFH